jgi:hypothetical protein
LNIKQLQQGLDYSTSFTWVALNQVAIQKAGENRQLFFSVRKARRAAA